MDIFDGIEISEEVKQALQKNLEQKITSDFVSRTELESVIKNRDEILAEKKAEQDKRRAQEEAAAAANLEASKAKGDIESVVSSYDQKISEYQKQLDQYVTKEKTQTLSQIAKSFVDENVVQDSFVRKAMTDEIMKRLDLREGKAVVLSSDGGLSSHSIDDLFTEFKTSSEFKPHIVVSKASGGSASGGNNAGRSSVSLAEKSLADAKTPEERKQILQARIDAKL